MKYLILIFLIFAAISSNAQKANFAILNKSDRVQINIYTTTTGSATCSGSGANTNIFISGAIGGLPQVGGICYTSRYGGVKFVGNGNWYYSVTWSTSYQINSLGVITAVFAC